MSNRENVVMHVSGLSYGGNYRNAIDGPSESYLFDNSYMVFDTTTDNLFPALKSTFIAATT